VNLGEYVMGMAEGGLGPALIHLLNRLITD
jgi:energy-converting hydrogenase Eha subunit B